MKKLRNEGGYTLSELLVAIIILVLVSSCMTLGINLAGKSLNQTVLNSRAEALAETLEELISDELRYAEDVVNSGGELASFTSISRGENASYLVKNGKAYIKTVQKGKTEEASVLGYSAYPDGVNVSTLSVRITDAGIFRVTLKLKKAGDTAELRSASFDVKPLTPIDIE